MTTATRNGTFPQDARAAVELYLVKGLAPIPLPPRSKDPGYPGWQNLRLNPDNLDQYFPRRIVRDTNVGILNGSPSHNHVDVDLDCPQVRKVAPMLLPETSWIFGRASSPRSHWIYRVDRSLDTAQVKFTDTDESMLIELRGTGGLTVFPPSTHKETGERILWDRFEAPGEIPLCDLQSAVGVLAAAAILARHWPAKGQRDQAAMALTGGLLRAGWSEDKASRFVEAVSVAAGDDEVRMRAEKAGPAAQKLEEKKKVIGWPTLAELVSEEAVSKARQWLGITPRKRRSSSKGSSHQFVVGDWVSPADRDNWGQIIEDLGDGRYLVHFVSPEGTEANVEFPADQLKPKDGAGAKIRIIPPFAPFPIKALPCPLDEFVRQGAAALGCDPCYLALPCLTVIAAAIGNTRTIKLKRGWEEPSILWSAIVGDSGTLKSPAYLKAVDPVLHRQRQLLEKFKEEKARYDEELAAYQASKKQAKSDGSDPGDPPEEPVLKRLVCSDTTVEKLAEILEDNPRGILVGRDELSGWLGSFDRYKVQKGGGDLANWLEMFRAGTAIVDRKSALRKTLYIRRASVSVTGGIQPGVLARALTQEFLDAGLGARLLMAMPRKEPKTWSEVEVAPEVEQAYEDILDKLLALDLALHPKTGEKVPHVLTISPDAKTAWIEFYNAWGREQANAEGELAAAFSKLEGYAARLALVHHVTTHRHLDSEDLRPVGRKSIEAGIVLTKWFAHEAERIYALLSESDDERAARCLVEYIRARGGEITVKDLQRSNSKKYPTAEHAEAVLQALVPQYGEWVDRPAGPKGGRPTRALKLLPDPPDETDETSPQGEKSARHPSDETSQNYPTKPQIPGEKESFVGFVGSRMEVKEPAQSPSRDGEVSSDGEGVSSDSLTESPPFQGKVLETTTEPLPTYSLVSRQEDLGTVAQALDETVLVGLDIETTGLDPRRDRVRLLSLAVDTIDGGRFFYLVDCFQVDPSPLWEVLAEKDLVGHNLLFDLSFLARLVFRPTGKVHDTMLLAQLLTAGTLERVTLAGCCERYLGRTLDKELQRSDWSGNLTEEQLSYAARDVEVLVPLRKALAAKIEEAGLVEVAEIEECCLPAIAWMASQGVALDRDAWKSLAEDGEREGERLRQELDRLAPGRPGTLEGLATWNWDSPTQVKEALALAGCKVEATDNDTLAAVDHPLAELLRQYRAASKKVKTYGAGWLEHVHHNGRVYPGWRQIGSRAGRMSCTEPNMQQLPRGEYRRCIVAPPGRVLVKADYSQVELRIAAKVSGDKALLEAYQRGEDLHTITARNVLRIQNVTKQDRQLAKALNFGLLYGMGARGFRQYARSQYGLDLTEKQAAAYRAAFFRSYPGLAAWHRQVGRSGKEAVETRTLAGRPRLEVKAFTEKLNTPVQGTGADGLKVALALLWERRDQAPGAFPVLAVHDEIVLECDED